MKRFFIGIDFSKQKFDAAIFDSKKGLILDNKEFENIEAGYKLMLKWIKQTTKLDVKQCLFCGEHTGLYSYEFSKFTVKKGLNFWLESGYQIKHSLGLVRGKTDKADAVLISKYAYRHQDKAEPFKGIDTILEQMKDLYAFRKRLTNTKKSLEVAAKELYRVKSNDYIVCYINDNSAEIIKQIESQLKEVERKIKELIKSNNQINENYKLLTSIKGIGMVNAALVLITTGNFTLFTNARKFGCYCGVVPFSHRSGTSVKGKDRVSHMANKELKTNLTLAARTAVMHDPKLREYYQRKILEGKGKSLVINNVRNKLIHTMFAVVKNRQSYDANFHHPLLKAA